MECDRTVTKPCGKPLVTKDDQFLHAWCVLTSANLCNL